MKNNDTHVHMDGTVVDVQKGKFWIELHQGQSKIIAQVSGKLRQHKIRILLGDVVTVALSTYDLSNGIIISRK